MPVIQFDYAYLSSVNEKGEQVRKRTILGRSTGYGRACVIDVEGGGDKYAISSAVWFLKDLVYTRFRCGTDPEPAIKAMVDALIKCLSDDRVVEQILPAETIPESHAIFFLLWRVGTISCKDKFERCDSTSKIDLGLSLVLFISACRGL